MVNGCFYLFLIFLHPPRNQPRRPDGPRRSRLGPRRRRFLRRTGLRRRRQARRSGKREREREREREIVVVTRTGRPSIPPRNWEEPLKKNKWQVTWLRADGGEVSAGQSNRIRVATAASGHTLRFRSVCDADLGVYRCRVANRHGQAEGRIEMSGKKKKNQKNSKQTEFQSKFKAMTTYCLANIGSNCSSIYQLWLIDLCIGIIYLISMLVDVIQITDVEIIFEFFWVPDRMPMGHFASTNRVRACASHSCNAHQSLTRWTPPIRFLLVSPFWRDEVFLGLQSTNRRHDF